jgi:alanine racemase
MAMDAGVDCFGVHSSDEAYALRKGLERMPQVFIMGQMVEESVEWAVAEGIEFAVFDHYRLHRALEAAKKLGIRAKVHMEVETGMRRTGFSHTEIPQLAQWLKDNKGARHLSGAVHAFRGGREPRQSLQGEQAEPRISELSLKAFAAHGPGTHFPSQLLLCGAAELS